MTLFTFLLSAVVAFAPDVSAHSAASNALLTSNCTTLQSPDYATWFQESYAYALGSQGHIYVMGPVVEAFPATWITGRVGLGESWFVARLDPASPVPAALTLFGGSSVEYFLGMTFDPVADCVVLVGATDSPDFPVTDGSWVLLDGTPRSAVLALDAATLTAIRFGTVLDGGQLVDVAVAGGDVYILGDSNLSATSGQGFVPIGNGGGDDVLLGRLSGLDGAFQNGLRLGGVGAESSCNLGIGSDGAVYVGGLVFQDAGLSAAERFPTTPGAFRSDPVAGSGGPGGGGGKRSGPKSDLFVCRLDAGLQVLEFSTLLGGSGRDGASAWGRMMTVRGTTVGVFGSTDSTDFQPALTLEPNLSGKRDGFVLVLDFAGVGAPGVVGGALVGGDGEDSIEGMALDGAGRVHILGRAGTGKGNNFQGIPTVDNGTGLLVAGSSIVGQPFLAVVDPAATTAAAMVLYASAVLDDNARPDGILLDDTLAVHLVISGYLLSTGEVPTTATAPYPAKPSYNAHWIGVFPSRLP